MGKMVKLDKFKVLCAMQILAIVLLATSYFGTQAERVAFDGVSEFLPVKAKCIKSYRTGSSSRSLKRRVRNYNGYNNTYQYEVNGQVYTTILYYESSKGSDRILYYHPEDPQICSEFKTLREASMHYVLFTLGGLLAQGVVIFFVCRSLGKDKEKIVVQQSTGVVLNDDYDFFMKSQDDVSGNGSGQGADILSMGNSDGKSTAIGSIPFARKEELTEIESIPFRKKEESTEIESIPFRRKEEPAEVESIPFGSKKQATVEESLSYERDEELTKSAFVSRDNEITSGGQTFALYTEEEYKSRSKKEI